MTARLLFDTDRFSVIRHSDGELEIAPKGAGRIRMFQGHAKRYLNELSIASHREGFAGNDRLCSKLLARWPATEHDKFRARIACGPFRVNPDQFSGKAPMAGRWRGS